MTSLPGEDHKTKRELTWKEKQNKTKRNTEEKEKQQQRNGNSHRRAKPDTFDCNIKSTHTVRYLYYVLYWMKPSNNGTVDPRYLELRYSELRYPAISNSAISNSVKSPSFSRTQFSLGSIPAALSCLVCVLPREGGGARAPFPNSGLWSSLSSLELHYL